MGKLMVTENAGLTAKIPLGETDKGKNLGVELGAEFQFKPPAECRNRNFYSSARHPEYEYKRCGGYTYWVLALFAAALRESGNSDASASVGFDSTLALSLNWTWAEQTFKNGFRFDYKPEPAVAHPLSLGLGPIGQYSSLQGWGGGVGANLKIADFVYLNGGVLLYKDGTSSQYLGLGLRNFLF